MKSFEALPVFVLVLLLVFERNICDCAASNTVNDEENEILDQWKEMDKNVAKITGSAIKMIMPHMMETASNVNLSSTCMKQSLQLITGVRRLKVWAFSFVDSSSKIIDGMLSGTMNSFGVYEQCLNSVAPSKNPSAPAFRGQYCQINIVPPLPPKMKRYKYNERLPELNNFTGSEIMNFLAEKSGMLYTFPYKIGLCVPSGCSANEIEMVINAMAGKMHLTAEVSYCDKSKGRDLKPIDIFALAVYCIILSIVIFSTGFEIFLKQKKKEYGGAHRYVLTFSAISNLKNLFSTKPEIEKLRSLYGMAFISGTMAVFIYSYLYPLFLMHTYKSMIDSFELMKKPMGHMIVNTSVVVDSFYVISGTILAFSTLHDIRSEIWKFDFWRFISKKIKFIPVYYFVILMSMLTSMMGSGPNFHEAMKFSIDNCHKYWWTNLLFINNFWQFDNMCLPHTWFFSCDAQLTFFSLIIFYGFKRSEKTGLMMTIPIIIISVLYTGAVTYFYDLIPGLDISYLDKDYRSETYLKIAANPLTHAGPFFIGILVGYFLVTKADFKISKFQQTVGWLLAILCSTYTMFWTVMWTYYQPTLLETSIFSALHRTVWSIGVAWTAFCCNSGHGGHIRTFLAWKPWVPLSKLVILIYLIHPTLEIMYIGTFQYPHEFSHYEMIIKYYGFLLMSGILAAACYLMIECPVSEILTLIIEKPIINVVHMESVNGIHANGDVKTITTTNIEMNNFERVKNNCVDNMAYDKGA